MTTNGAPNYGVKYSVFIGDDDSSTIAKIYEEVGYNVENGLTAVMEQEHL